MGQLISPQPTLGIPLASSPPCSPTIFTITGHTMLSLKDAASTTGIFPPKKGAVGSSGTTATGVGMQGPFALVEQFSC